MAAPRAPRPCTRCDRAPATRTSPRPGPIRCRPRRRNRRPWRTAFRHEASSRPRKRPCPNRTRRPGPQALGNAQGAPAAGAGPHVPRFATPSAPLQARPRSQGARPSPPQAEPAAARGSQMPGALKREPTQTSPRDGSGSQSGREPSSRQGWPAPGGRPQIPPRQVSHPLASSQGRSMVASPVGSALTQGSPSSAGRAQTNVSARQ